MKEKQFWTKLSKLVESVQENYLALEQCNNEQAEHKEIAKNRTIEAYEKVLALCDFAEKNVHTSNPELLILEIETIRFGVEKEILALKGKPLTRLEIDQSCKSIKNKFDISQKKKEKE